MCDVLGTCILVCCYIVFYTFYARDVFIVVTARNVYEHLSPGGICRCAFTKQHNVIYILYTVNITNNNIIPR